MCDFYVVHGVARGTGTPKDRHEVNRREESPRGTSALAFLLLKKDTKKHVERFHTTLNLNIEAYPYPVHFFPGIYSFSERGQEFRDGYGRMAPLVVDALIE